MARKHESHPRPPHPPIHTQRSAPHLAELAGQALRLFSAGRPALPLLLALRLQCACDVTCDRCGRMAVRQAASSGSGGGGGAVPPRLRRPAAGGYHQRQRTAAMMERARMRRNGSSMARRSVGSSYSALRVHERWQCMGGGARGEVSGEPAVVGPAAGCPASASHPHQLWKAAYTHRPLAHPPQHIIVDLDPVLRAEALKAAHAPAKRSDNACRYSSRALAALQAGSAQAEQAQASSSARPAAAGQVFGSLVRPRAPPPPSSHTVLAALLTAAARWGAGRAPTLRP